VEQEERRFESRVVQFDMPKVSALISLHNKGEFVLQCIQSVANQSCRDFEIVVVENGSSDSGPDIVKKLAQSDERIRFFDATGDVSGPGAARNFGLAKATGEWVLFLDADDFVEPNHLENLLDAAQKSAQVEILAGGWKEFEMYDSTLVTKWPTAFGQGADKLVENSLAFAPWAVHAAMVRREWLEQNSLRWFEDLDGWPSEDTAFWFAVLQGARVAWANSAAAVYRLDTANSRNAANQRAKWLEGLRGVIAKNLETLAATGKCPSPSQIATLVRVYESRYREALQAGDQEAAAGFRREMRQWLKKTPWWKPRMLLRKIKDLGEPRITSNDTKRGKHG
jgi:glycosyltransferase involved in cell wall biosynthesis